MGNTVPERLGERLRRVRKARNFGLRETAARDHISATYLSRIETSDEKNPPDEEKLRALAAVLGDDVDTLMTLAGRVPSDAKHIITDDPTMLGLLRWARARHLTGNELL